MHVKEFCFYVNVVLKKVSLGFFFIHLQHVAVCLPISEGSALELHLAISSQITDTGSPCPWQK